MWPRSDNHHRALVWKISSGGTRSSASAGVDFFLNLVGAVVTCTLAGGTRAGGSRTTTPASAQVLGLLRAVITSTLTGRTCACFTRSVAATSAEPFLDVTATSARSGSLGGIWAGFAFALTFLTSALGLSLAGRAARSSLF